MYFDKNDATLKIMARPLLNLVSSNIGVILFHRIANETINRQCNILAVPINTFHYKLTNSDQFPP